MYLQMYQEIQIKRMGLSHVAICPYDAYPTVDGQILIGVQNVRGWHTLVIEVFDRPDLAGHPKCATNILRVQHRAEVDVVVGGETRFDTVELDHRLAKAGIPVAQLGDMTDLIAHPQLAARGRWREVDTEAGPIRAVLPPMTFRDVAMRTDPVAALGQQTDAVLAELGLTDEQITGLHTAGIVQ
ncbi:possible acyl-CoA transferase, C-terminal (plasmid) [Rhodococcus jostii RHA1]|uniref:Possible acyl-CoA transferase, C-terminal n=1 Tax=Rhodococcus jostii (strain RHA1) TaxID=101510 RepID=Q0RWL3_RHOJR|nr:possible acyl-CoA transferase, C-terminal [Rhodococcus jostii RHA1]